MTESATINPPPATSPAVVGVAKLSRRIDGRDVLIDVDLSIPAGRFVAVMGPNGAGKTSLLNVLATLHRPTSGRLELFNQPAAGGSAALRARIGLLAHQPMLYADLSLRQNLEFFGRLYDVPRPGSRAIELASRLGLADRLDDSLKTFSRGMVQRAALARALMHGPELLLADEPFTGLDAAGARLFESVLAELHRAGRTIVMVDHDAARSLRLAQRVIVLRAGRVAMDQPTASLDADRLQAEATR